MSAEIKNLAPQNVWSCFYELTQIPRPTGHMNPQLLVLDEPNSYIDSSFEVKFYDLLREINKSSTIILVSHDDEALNNLASRVIHIDEKSL